MAPRWMSSISLEARRRDVDGEAIGQRVGVLAECQQRAPLRGAAAGDPAADRVGGMQARRRARSMVGLVGGDESAELFEGRHCAGTVTGPRPYRQSIRLSHR